jgi:hypothetical protein
LATGPLVDMLSYGIFRQREADMVTGTHTHYVCMYVCMYDIRCGETHYVCMYVYVCMLYGAERRTMYVCMYVCMYIQYV